MANFNTKDLEAVMAPILNEAIRRKMKTCGVPNDLIEKAMTHTGDDQAELIYCLCQIYSAELFRNLPNTPIKSSTIRFPCYAI